MTTKRKPEWWAARFNSGATAFHLGKWAAMADLARFDGGKAQRVLFDTPKLRAQRALCRAVDRYVRNIGPHGTPGNHIRLREAHARYLKAKGKGAK